MLPKILLSSALILSAGVAGPAGASTPATVPGQLDQLVKQYLSDQVNSITENRRSNRLAGTNALSPQRVADPLSSELAQEAARVQRLRAVFHGNSNELDWGRASMLNSTVRVSGATASMTVTEVSDLHYAYPQAGPAQFTSYRIDHDFQFALIGGQWKITEDTLAIPPGSIEPLPYERVTRVPGKPTPATTALPGLVPAYDTKDPKLRKPAPAGPRSVAYNRQKATDYALQWALGRNPIFDQYGNDCTNFVSQTMEAGGWDNDGYPDDGPDKWWGWWNEANQKILTNKTWRVADDMMRYGFNYSHRYRNYTGQQAQLGDAVFADWDDAAGNLGHDGHMDHAMVITQPGDGWSWDQILVSYHTNDTKNLSMNAVAAKQANGGDVSQEYFYFMDPTGY